MKRDLEPGDRGNRALATDLASFAVDGGVLLIGVDEGPPATPSPIPLDGLKERIDQVARSRIDPPLAVSITEIASAADPSRGYLVVVLPASPAAPHMVEHRYLGRGDTTNMRLSDSQVVRLHAARAAALTSASALLDAEIARDPFPPDARQNGHIFVVAQPTFGSAELLEGAVADMRNWMYELRKLRRITGQFAPDIEGLSDVQRRANGWALTNLGEGRVPQTRVDESITLDVEANEDGGIRRAVRVRGPPQRHVLARRPDRRTRGRHHAIRRELGPRVRGNGSARRGLVHGSEPVDRRRQAVQR